MIIDGFDVCWDEITRDQLKHLSYEKDLSDSAVAQLFGISASKVRNKRKKFNLSDNIVNSIENGCACTQPFSIEMNAPTPTKAKRKEVGNFAKQS